MAMRSRRLAGIAVVAVFLVAAAVVGYATLTGPESLFLPERLVYFQQAALVTAGSTSTAHSATTELPQGVNNASAATALHGNSINGTIRMDTSTPATGQEIPADTDAEDQKADVSTPQDSNSTAVRETDPKVPTHAQLNESIPTPEQQPKESEQSTHSETTRVYDLDELMTPELIHKIENQESNCLSPVQVHLIWIGDISKAPNDRLKYVEQGYNITIHTSAEEILDGFHPYVLKAYQQAIPKVVGYDFLKFALLYKYGGFAVDADTSPAVPASEIKWPSDCDVIFGKEAVASNWEKPVFRQQGGPTYGLIRPFQILNWAMAVSKPRNPHIKWMLKTAMMHFFGLRDMELILVQDISGSGLMTDYVALLHEKEGRSYRDVYEDRSKYIPVEGLCLTDGHLHGSWIQHHFLNSWRQPGEH